jgi:hypothetical protein
VTSHQVALQYLTLCNLGQAKRDAIDSESPTRLDRELDSESVNRLRVGESEATVSVHLGGQASAAATPHRQSVYLEARWCSQVVARVVSER